MEAQHPMSREPIRSAENWSSPRPYTPAVLLDGWLYVSGHVPADASGATAGVTAGEQARQVMKNIGHTLEAGGAVLGDIISTNVFLTDMHDIDDVDEVYREVFADSSVLPSRTTVQISSLGRPEWRVEISAVARLGASKW